MKIADLEKKLEEKDKAVEAVRRSCEEKSGDEMRKRTEEISRLEVQLAEKEALGVTKVFDGFLRSSYRLTTEVLVYRFSKSWTVRFCPPVVDGGGEVAIICSIRENTKRENFFPPLPLQPKRK